MLNLLHDHEVRIEGLAEGIQQGRAEGRAETHSEMLNDLIELMRTNIISPEQFDAIKAAALNTQQIKQ